jgi:hypothetical protein
MNISRRDFLKFSGARKLVLNNKDIKTLKPRVLYAVLDLVDRTFDLEIYNDRTIADLEAGSCVHNTKRYCILELETFELGD